MSRILHLSRVIFGQEPTSDIGPIQHQIPSFAISKPSTFTTIFRIVQLATIALFLGRAMEHLIWDAPFRALLWDETWMKGLVEAVLGMQWEDYITSMSIDDQIQRLIRLNGWFYLFCVFVALFIWKLPRIFAKVLLLGAASLVVLAFLFFKEKFFSIGQFLEYSLQFSTPVFLYLLYRKESYSKQMVVAMKVGIAITFTCHGLYAIGYYPQPGHFVEMVINILRVDETQAIFLLKGMGVLDFLVSVLIFFPKRIAKPALIYCIFWGAATSFARILTNWEWTLISDNLMQHLHDCILRFPHFLIPLAVYLILKKEEKSIRKV